MFSPGGGQVDLKQNVVNRVCSNKALRQQLLARDVRKQGFQRLVTRPLETETLMAGCFQQGFFGKIFGEHNFENEILGLTLSTRHFDSFYGECFEQDLA